jgi:uracil phosphoribosyltransferase
MIRILDEEGHPVIGELLFALRDEQSQGSRGSFRDALRRLGALLAYEAARDLPTRESVAQAPFGPRAQRVLDTPVVLAPILRAAVPLWQGCLEIFRESDTLVLGAQRKEGAFDPGSGRIPIELGYAALVPLAGRTLIYVDPMLATGSTLRAVHELVVRRAGRPSRVLVLGAIAYRPTLEQLARELDATVIVGSADEGLDDRGYILPGLGDAGDLAFGPKFAL